MLFTEIITHGIKQKIRAVKPRPVDNRPVAAVIFGAGDPPGIGAAVAQRIARAGMRVYVTGRTESKIRKTAEVINQAGGDAVSLTADVTEQTQINAAFAQIENDGFAVDLVVHNVGTAPFEDFLDITADRLEQGWRTNCLSGFFIAQQALQRMQPRERGSLIFTGATASLRGGKGFANFAAGKNGLRILAQALAREFGPQGIHVAHVIVDGGVDSNPPDAAEPGRGNSLHPDHIAQAYWQLYQQHRSAWTHELDLRPFEEQW